MAKPIIDLTKEDFEVQTGSGMWLVEFWASWCAPCRALQPVLEELACELDGPRIGRVEITQEPSLAQQHDVKTVPTMMLFCEGAPVKKLFGVKTKRQILRTIDEVSGSAARD